MGRHLSGVSSCHKSDAYLAAAYFWTIGPDDHLELLRLLMGSAMELRGRKQPCVVGKCKVSHELGNELLSRQTSERSVSWRNEEVKTADRRSNPALLPRTTESRTNGNGGRTQSPDRIACGKMVLASACQAFDILLQTYAFVSLIHLVNITIFVTFLKQKPIK